MWPHFELGVDYFDVHLSATIVAEILGCFDDILLFIPRCLPSAFPPRSGTTCDWGRSSTADWSDPEIASIASVLPRLHIFYTWYGIASWTSFRICIVAFNIFLRCSGLVWSVWTCESVFLIDTYHKFIHFKQILIAREWRYEKIVEKWSDRR